MNTNTGRPIAVATPNAVASTSAWDSTSASDSTSTSASVRESADTGDAATRESSVIIEAGGVRKRYGNVQALDGIDLTITRGEVVAILGPNGAGKTSLIEVLLGMRRADEGSVSLLGQSPTAVGIRARIGAMLQDTDAPKSQTVGEIVDLVAHYYPWALPIEEVLQRADLLSKRDNRVAQLSGGQRQRLSFAMAIVGDPDVLFLDEPTAALDVEARRALWQQVRGFAELGKTVLFSTHNMDEADALADRIVVISAGRIVADGSPAHIKSLVAARQIQVTSDIPLACLRDHPRVRSVEATSAVSDEPNLPHLTIHTADAEGLLAEIFTGGYVVAHLTVSDTDLESAFVRLTQSGRAPQPEEMSA